MGILFGFLLVCMILYAILVSHAAYFILKLFLINLMSTPIFVSIQSKRSIKKQGLLFFVLIQYRVHLKQRCFTDGIK